MALRNLAILCVFFSFTAPAFAATKSVVTCPIVASQKSGAYQALKKSDFTCFSSTRAARTAGFTSGQLFINTSFKTIQQFAADGSGDANTPAFRITNASAQVHYNYTGGGIFRINVIDQTTGKLVLRLVDTDGPAGATTYINRSGVFYLEISGSSKPAQSNGPSGSWKVNLDVLE